MSIVENFRKHKIKIHFALFLAIGFVLPVWLIAYGIIPFKYRFHTFIAMTILSTVYIKLRGHSFRDIGFKIKKLGQSIFMNIAIVMGGAISFFVVISHDLLQTLPHSSTFFIFYLTFLGPAQEFLYRGVLFAEMEKAMIASPFLKVAISSSVFSFLHLIYFNIIALAVTFAIGIVWGIMYLKCRNIYGLMLSHSLLGAMAIYVGVV